MGKVLIADENFPFPGTIYLRKLGYDIVTLEDLDKNGLALSGPDLLATT